MNYSIYLLLSLATATPKLPKLPDDLDEEKDRTPDLDDVLDLIAQDLRKFLAEFLTQPVTPSGTQTFERELQKHLREAGRQLVQCVYNHREPAAVDELPKHAQFEGDSYTRLNRKTSQNAWTLFGQIQLWRVGYRDKVKGGEPSIFPLALALGLVQGASPALSERVSELLGEAGATQKRVLKRLRQECAVGWGVKKLRLFSNAMAAELAPQQHDAQVEQVLQWLRQAEPSRGRHKPVLCVGRDGVTLGLRYKKCCSFEVATTGTVSVLDRRGKRLGTVYLAYVPELGQETMSAALTRLLQDILRRWDQSLPRLCYVTDAGHGEAGYYQKVLAQMVHPRTGAALQWLRVVDYYHASQRVWQMAELLFGSNKRGKSWAWKMLRWMLRKPRGVNRVLHSAAALRDQVGLSAKKREAFQKAYRYLRKRMKYMCYDEYKRLGMPRGSGVTETACKTVYTQRLKLSGMRWKKAGRKRFWCSEFCNSAVFGKRRTREC